MSALNALVGVIAATLPAHSRPRYLEEWRADLEGASELDVAPWSIVLGAAATAISIDRLAPSVTGMTRGALALRRARWAGAFLGTALVLGFGWLIGALPFVVQVIAMVSVLVGALLLAGAAVAAFGGSGPRRVAIGIGVIAGAVLVMAISLFMPLLGALSFFGIAAGVVIVLIAAGRGGAGTSMPRARRVSLALPFSLMTLAAGFLGVMHIVVWSPLAKVPGMTLDEIYAAMAAAGEGTGVVFIVAWAVCWTLGAVALPVLVALPFADHRIGRRAIATAGFLLIGTTVFGQWFAGFSMGMGLADTFMTSGADAAATGLVLTWIGQGSIIAALFCALPPRRLALSPAS